MFVWNMHMMLVCHVVLWPGLSCCQAGYAGTCLLSWWAFLLPAWATNGYLNYKVCLAKFIKFVLHDPHMNCGVLCVPLSAAGHTSYTYSVRSFSHLAAEMQRMFDLLTGKGERSHQPQSICSCRPAGVLWSAANTALALRGCEPCEHGQPCMGSMGTSSPGGITTILYTDRLNTLWLLKERWPSWFVKINLLASKLNVKMHAEMKRQK